MTYRTASKPFATFLYKQGYRCVFERQDGNRIYAFEIPDTHLGLFKRLKNEFHRRGS